MAKLPRKLKFESALQRLEEIVDAMEGGELGIEESVERYSDALALARHCREILDRAEQRVQEVQADADGSPRLRDLNVKRPDES